MATKKLVWGLRHASKRYALSLNVITDRLLLRPPERVKSVLSVVDGFYVGVHDLLLGLGACSRTNMYVYIHIYN